MPDPLETDEGDVQARSPPVADAQLAVSYFYLKGTDTQPLSGSGNIPWVDRDFKWTQHNLNVADTWTLSPTIINQLRFTYMRQFGGRVNNPTTSLGDLNSKFTIQGDPTLPRLTVSGYFTGQVGDRRSRCRQRLLRGEGQPEHEPRQSLVQVRRRSVVREDRPRHAARQLRRVHLQRQQDRQRLRRLPARPARDDDAGCAGAEDRQRRLHQPVRAGRLPHPPARHAEPRRPLRPAVPVHRSGEPQARVRARRAVAGVADRAGGPALPRRSGHQPRHRQDRQQQHRAAPRHRLGSARRRPHVGARGAPASSTAASPATSGTRRPTISRSPCASRSRP